MKPVNNSIIRVLITKKPELGKIQNYIYKDKNYTDWLRFLRFGLQRLLTDDRLSEEEKLLVLKNKKIINKFAKVKRPAPYLRKHIIELEALIEILLNYE